MKWSGGTGRSQGGAVQMKSGLAEQPSVASCSCTAMIRARACVFDGPHPFRHTQSEHLPFLRAPRGRCPTPDPALLISAGPVAKRKSRGCGGEGHRSAALRGAVTADQSAQLRAFSSGRLCPAGHPQAPLRPPGRPRSLKRAPQDSGLWRRAFVLWPQGGRKGVGIDD